MFNCYICHTENVLLAPAIKGNICNECGFIWVSDVPEDTSAIFKNSADTSGAASLFHQRADNIFRHIVPERVMEIGCQNGAFLATLQSRCGCQVAGVDPCASQNLEVIQPCSFEVANFAPASFDLVVSSNVFYRHPHPRNVLQKIKTILQPSGLLYLELGMLLNEWSYFTGSGKRDQFPLWFGTTQPIYCWYHAAHIYSLLESEGFHIIGNGTLNFQPGQIPQTYHWYMAQRTEETRNIDPKPVRDYIFHHFHDYLGLET